jgi:hypothetical protein
MKKICSLIVILIASHFAVSAQYNKGSIYIDGSVNYSNDNVNVYKIGVDDVSKSKTFIVTPNIGYFIRNNFVVGIGLEYQSLYSLNSSITGSNFSNGVLTDRILDVTTTNWKEVAPTVFAKYIFPISDQLSFSLKAKFSHGLLTDNVSVVSNAFTYDSNGTVTDHTESEIKSVEKARQTNRFNLSPELQYLITDKIGLQVNFTGLSYSSVPVIQSAYETIDGKGFDHVFYYGTQKTTTFNINPSSWSFGLFVLLGGKDSKEKKNLNN